MAVAETGRTGGRTDEQKAAGRDRLRAIISDQSVRTGGDFTLASGRHSTVFFDMKKTILDPEGAALVGDAFLDLLDGEAADFVGGLVMGAVPIVSAVCVRSVDRRPARAKPLRGFFVRKEAKDHGTAQQIDGHLEDGAQVVVVEDVTTTGGSALKAVDAVRARGCTVATVLTIVDRLEGAEENLKSHGLKLAAVFTKNDFA